MNSEAVIISVIGIGLTGAAMAVLLRQYCPEFGMLITLAAAALIFLSIVQWMAPILDRIKILLAQFPLLSEHTSILLKAVGICFLTQLACGLCRDAGENSIAAHVEAAGKIAILVTSLPLFEQILDLVLTLLEI